MIDSLIIAIGGITSLMIIWMIVQSLWGKTFSDHLSDEDVLAGRTSCRNCGCTTSCKKEVEKI
jgi:hypothetical protein